MAGKTVRRIESSSVSGEGKRIDIAIGLLKESCVFILDEPTSGLDTGNESGIANVIQSIEAKKSHCGHSFD